MFSHAKRSILIFLCIWCFPLNKLCLMPVAFVQCLFWATAVPDNSHLGTLSNLWLRTQGLVNPPKLDHCPPPSHNLAVVKMTSNI